MIIGGICLLLFVGFFYLIRADPNQYDEVAKCITDAGTKMYGAYWCPHCQQQKKMFSKSWKHIHYIECAEGRQGQTKECQDAGITGYPTWEFSDGTRISGEQNVETLARLSGCEMSAHS